MIVLESFQVPIPKRTFQKSGRLILSEFVIKLIQLIEFRRKMFNLISTLALLLKLFELALEHQKYSIATNQKIYSYRILKRLN